MDPAFWENAYKLLRRELDRAEDMDDVGALLVRLRRGERALGLDMAPTVESRGEFSAVIGGVTDTIYW